METVNAVPVCKVAGHQFRLSLLDLDEEGHWCQLTEIIRALTCLDRTHDLLSCFLSAALELLGADRGHVRILERSSGKLVLRAQHGFDGLSESDFSALWAAPLQAQALSLRRRVVTEDSENSDLGFRKAFGVASRWTMCRAMQATPLIDSSGHTLGLLTTYNETPHAPGALQWRLLDVLCLQVVALFERTEEKEQLLGAERRKDDFLATLAHELRNSIAPLCSSLELLKFAPLTNPLHERARAILDRRLHHMMRLVDDLMDTSRVAVGKLQLQMERATLSSILESAIETVTPVIAEFDHELTTTLPDNDVTLYGDLVRLAQVFVNLLQNAAKYTPKGGRIFLSVRQQMTGVEVEVRDSGIGIAAEVLPHVFELFSQATAATEHRSGGLGVGLALVKGLVEMHGGSVHANSAGRDQGTTLTVWLPMVGAGEKRPPASDIVPLVEARTQQLRVLVVDDNHDAADSLAGLLAVHGHEVRTAYDGLEAVEVTHHYHPDLILLDIGMPRLGGIEAAERIRALPLPCQPQIIELSAAASPAESERAAAAGISAHLLKPVEFATLDAVMQAAARNMEALRETRLKFVINNLELALTLLWQSRRCNELTIRARSLDNARRAYERANALLVRLQLDAGQKQSIEGSLRQLKAELLAEGEHPDRFPWNPHISE